MLFNSFRFIGIFLPVVLAVYWLTQRHSRSAALIWLAGASYFFYVVGEPVYPWLILASIAFNYWVGRLIGRATAGKKALLILGVTVNLCALGYLKYFNFAAAQLHNLTGFVLTTKSVVLPLGISFFTFTQIAYLADVYQNIAADYQPVSYFLFVTFFPHLIAGPILHHKEMMPQFARRDAGLFRNHFAAGLSMFAVGLFKKTVVADSVAPVASGLFNALTPGSHITFLPAWMAALTYTVQIYFDFSGYSDMAVGIARMFGIDLPVNFNSPYKAVSIIDFWRRWHITLSRFLRDYLYIPLGGSRRGEPRRLVNIFVTMVLGGIWHGAGWTFLLWGVLHGIYITINHAFLLWRREKPPMPRLVSSVITFVCVVFAWVPFRATTLSSTIAMWKGMIGVNGIQLPDLPGTAWFASRLHLGVQGVGFGRQDIFFLFAALLACWFLPNSQELLANFRLGLDSPGYHALPAAPNSRLAVQQKLVYAVLLGIILGLGLRSISGYSEFIYFHF